MQADAVAVRLRQSGHSVFFDRDALPPAESFDERIRRAIAQSDLLLFLVSPESVAAGGYSLTELEFARARWKDPTRRILPVMVADTPYEDLPAYLRAVTILEPKGNFEAETVAAVARLAQRPWLRWSTAVAGALAAAALAALWVYQQEPDERQYRRTYFAGFDAAAHPDDDVWMVGTRADWAANVVDGHYRLCNVTGNTDASFQNRFQYFDKSGALIEQSDSKVSIKVKLEPPLAQYSSAGILYRKGPGESGFYIFVLSGGGTVSVGQYSESLRFLWSGEMNIDDRDFVKLAAEGFGNKIDFKVNDETVHTLSETSILAGDPGIFALSSGCFVFDDAAVYLPVSP